MKKIDKEELHTIFRGMESNNEFYFNMLYEKYKKLVYAIAFSILKDKENSEDVVQKVYIKIWKMEKQKLPKNNEACWLYSMTKNEAIDLIKCKKTMLNIDALYYISEENKDLNEVIDRDSYNRILAKLNTQEQEIISLKVLSNLSFKEISQILNMPESTVKWKYYKSIHTLKLLLSNLGMFIITFVIGLKTILSNQRQSSQIPNEMQENISVPDTSTTSSEQQKVENYEDYRQEDLSDSVQEDTAEQVIIQEQVNINNYYEIGILGISSIFLIFTIIFSIIFVKHQLKRKHKSSK